MMDLENGAGRVAVPEDKSGANSQGMGSQRGWFRVA